MSTQNPIQKVRKDSCKITTKKITSGNELLIMNENGKSVNYDKNEKGK